MRWLLLVLLASCAVDQPPKGAVSIEDTEAVRIAREAWVEVGLPNTDRCPAPWWLPVSADELERRCGLPSCTKTLDNCVLACVNTDIHVAYWDRDQQGFEAYTQAHECYHQFSRCLLGTQDHDHVNPRVWNDAMNLVVSRLYAAASANLDAGLPGVD